MSRQPDKYRSYAEDCRLEARKTWREDDKAEWLKMAAAWERLADSIDGVQMDGAASKSAAAIQLGEKERPS